MRPTLVVALLILMTAPAWAATQAPAPEATAPPLAKTTQHGVSFVSGGVGQTEQAELRQLQPKYDARVVMTDPKGEYLDDLHVTLDDAQGHRVVDTTTQGPILLAQLPPGHYRLTTSLDGWTTEQRRLDVTAKSGHEAQLYVALHKENVG